MKIRNICNDDATNIMYIFCPMLIDYKFTNKIYVTFDLVS